MEPALLSNKRRCTRVEVWYIIEMVEAIGCDIIFVSPLGISIWQHPVPMQDPLATVKTVTQGRAPGAVYFVMYVTLNVITQVLSI